MSAPLESYLRTYRKRSGFSQDEVAFLLGCQSGAKVSRYEWFGREPNLRTVFAYEVIFRTPASVLFGGMYEKVEKRTRARARLLAERLAEGRPERATLRKLAILESLASGPAGSQRSRR
jgi:transcriptional regulator with XRE-family HTH domain